MGKNYIHKAMHSLWLLETAPYRARCVADMAERGHVTHPMLSVSGVCRKHCRLFFCFSFKKIWKNINYEEMKDYLQNI